MAGTFLKFPKQPESKVMMCLLCGCKPELLLHFAQAPAPDLRLGEISLVTAGNEFMSGWELMDCCLLMGLGDTLQ